jgi:hypothetical protein
MENKYIEEGNKFEKFFSQLTGSELVKGSGNKWYALLDADGIGQILWSLKWTSKKSFDLTDSLIDEMVEAVDGPGGRGGNTIPALGVGLQGEVLAVFRVQDLMRVLSEERALFRPSKGDVKKSLAQVPELLREET